MVFPFKSLWLHTNSFSCKTLVSLFSMQCMTIFTKSKRVLPFFSVASQWISTDMLLKPSNSALRRETGTCNCTNSSETILVLCCSAIGGTIGGIGGTTGGTIGDSAVGGTIGDQWCHLTPSSLPLQAREARQPTITDWNKIRLDMIDPVLNLIVLHLILRVSKPMRLEPIVGWRWSFQELVRGSWRPIIRMILICDHSGWFWQAGRGDNMKTLNSKDQK